MRVENTSDRQYDVYALPKEGRTQVMYSIPRSNMTDTGRVNGVGEIPDDVLTDLMVNDVWTKGVFDSGDLVATRASKATAIADDATKAKPAK